MGNAERNGGEYYTPRPLIRAIIAVTKPKIGERLYDGACGSAGFLCEAFAHLHSETRRLAALYERKLAALEALKKSLLHQAFSGQL
jgi:type I restriction enzyme M protein